MNQAKTSDPNKCNHDWEPILKWGGRYKCKLCSTIGHKPMEDCRSRKDIGKIISYRCQKNKCGAPAQVSNRRGTRYYFPHWEEYKKRYPALIKDWV